MGLFDGIVGGIVGAEMATVVNGLIQKHGGIQGIVSQFEKQGLGATVKSWVGTGPNQSVAPDQIHQVLGADMIADMAARTGVPATELLNRLASALPEVIDKLTPNGTVPAQ
jgi:uncharacterized protein YidB (DUF937 family)